MQDSCPQQMHRHRGSGFPDGSSYCLPQPRPVHRACHANCKKKNISFLSRTPFPPASFSRTRSQPLWPKAVSLTSRSQGLVLDLRDLEDVFGVDRICVDYHLNLQTHIQLRPRGLPSFLKWRCAIQQSAFALKLSSQILNKNCSKKCSHLSACCQCC